MTKLKLNFKTILKYTIYMIVLFLLSRAGVNGMKPFAFAFFAALIFLKQDMISLTLMYITCGYLACFELFELIYLASEAMIMIGIILLLKYLKRHVHIGLFGVYVLMSQVIRLVYYKDAATSADIVLQVISAILTVIFTYAYINALRAILIRGLRFKTTIDEIVSICMLIIGTYVGIIGVNIYGIDISLIVGVFAILIAGNIFGVSGSAVIACTLGVSGLVFNNDVSLLASYVIYAMIHAIFCKTSRQISAISVLLVEILLSYFFELYGVYSYLRLISIGIPCFLYSIMPKRSIEIIVDMFGGVNENMLSRYVVNRNKSEISKRLMQLSDVFNEMNRMYERLIVGKINEDERLKSQCGDLKELTCDGCGEANKCWGRYKDSTYSSFADLLTCGSGKGKVTLMDLDTYLTARCARVNTLLQNTNQMLSNYRQNMLMTKNMDTSKALLSRQMSAVSDVMKGLSKSISTRVIFNLELEKELLDELSVKNVVCNEIIIYGDNYDDLSVSLVLMEKDAYRMDLSEIISRVCKIKMMVISRECSERKGWNVITVRPAPKYDVVFGTALLPRHDSPVSGDTHSLIRISEEKFMLCLCDGMGSGTKAEEISSTAISLVENFYLAGFPDDVVLGSVNKLLAYVGEDVFAAIDIGVVDLKNAKCDFIKIGACESYIKGSMGVKRIEGSSLPLGILEDIVPWTINAQLSSGDIIIMVSDGIVESFESSENLKNYITSRTTLNPKTMADEILEEAVVMCSGEPADDMTVVAIKLFCS